MRPRRAQSPSQHQSIVSLTRAARETVLTLIARFTDADVSFSPHHLYLKIIDRPLPPVQRVCARIADFQFRPDLYEDDATTEGSGNAPFPLEKWQQGLGLSRLTQQMYFL